MLINGDVKSLEVVVAAELAQDKTLIGEILEKLDTHADNQNRFGFPSRIIAKRFIFKLLYGATAYGYTTDSDFLEVGYSQTHWQEVIDQFYTKYHGIYKWHQKLLRQVQENNGIIDVPSGRFYKFDPDYSKREPWPLTQIKNYPVQGFGADLVMLARIEFFKRFKESGLEGYFIQTIHDSLVADVPSKNVAPVAKMLQEAVAKVPELCYNRWNYKFSLPMTSEVLVGPNKFDMKEYNGTNF